MDMKRTTNGLTLLRAAPLQLRLFGGIALVLAASASQSLLTYRTTIDNAAAAEWVQHTEAVLALAGETQIALLEMETNYRGFLIAGDEAFLKSYAAAAQSYPTNLTMLEQLTADNPSQVARWQKLAQHHSAWQHDVVEPGIALRRISIADAPSGHAAVAVTASPLGEQDFDDIELLLTEAMGVEGMLLDQRHAKTDASNSLLVAELGWGTLALLGVGLLVAVLYSRSLTQAITRVRAGERRYRQMFANNPAIKLLIDPISGAIIEANQAACDFYGYPRPDLLRRHSWDISILSADELLVRLKRVATNERTSYLARHRLASGEVRDVDIQASPVDDDVRGHALLYLIVQDVTERKQAEEALRHQALHDALTDLPNRTLLQDRLSQAILAGRREDTPVALLLIDLDRFKEINDTFGHHYGDLLLQQIGPRLAGVLRASDTIARLGGDEFAVLLPGTSTASAVSIAEMLLRVLAAPFALDSQAVETGGSIGVASYPVHGNDAATLLRQADVAMYVAKRAQSGIVVYASEQDHYSAERLALGGELRLAIENNELILQYQPKLDLTGRLAGVEALVRWRHPQRGIIAPDEFIGLAEHIGLIKPLTRWVLDAALQQCRTWLNTGLGIQVAVNVSMHDLHDDTLPDTIARLLVARGVPAEYLRIEITEGAIMSDAGRALSVLTRLRALGVSISVDDFGTGYSSLAYLKRLPVDELKIDRSFIRNIATDEEDAAIVRSTIGLGHELGLTIVAEGVEDQAGWDQLSLFGCDRAQGYFMARPLFAPDLNRWLTDSGQFPAGLQEAA
jgi:diguanylate cyclase (GGDEF)-like protein/PAS domain S-box-containing protein